MQKEKLIDLTGLLIGIILASIIFSGLGRVIQGIGFTVGIYDGFSVAFAISLSIILTAFFRIPPGYSVAIFVISGFTVGVISELIFKNLLFITSGLSSALLCLSYVLSEIYSQKKNEKGNMKILSLFSLAGLSAGLISGFVFNFYFYFILLSSANLKNIIQGTLYWALWGGLIMLGIKLSALYLKQIIFPVLKPLLTNLIYGLITGIGTGIFGTIIETINYSNANLYAESQVATFSRALTLSFLRDGLFGFTFGLIFAILTKPKIFQKFGNIWFLIPGGLTGFLSLKIINRFLPFVLSPLGGVIFGISIGLSITLSNREEMKSKKQVRSLIFSACFGFLALILSSFIEGKFQLKSFFYFLGFGLLGAIYGFIIMFSKLISDYYLGQKT